MTDLRTTYLGLPLRSPLVASAGPHTGTLAGMRELAEAGVAAIVLPSLFEEQIVHDALSVHGALEAGAGTTAEAPGGWFPELRDYNTGPDRYLTLLEEAKEAVAVPVIASLNATTSGGWVRYARLLEQAGADALELNVYVVAADPTRTGAEVEAAYLELVADVRSVLSIPLAVKLSPFFSSFAHMAAAVVDAGADGLVLFNRFYQPDVDVDTLAVMPTLQLSTSAEGRLPVRWIAILRDQLGDRASLAATTGVHTAADAAKALLVGADVTMMTSAVLRNGPHHVADVEADLCTWMVEHGYDSVSQLRGSVSHGVAEDPSAFERATYVRTLTSYRATTSRR
jgi:dihydroorotate dehydrogenase (fumarate)